MSKPLYRHTPDTQLAGARRDIEMLKRRPFGLGGIRFNVLNESVAGGFLDVTTHSYTSFLNDGAGGVLLQDSGTGGVALLSDSFIGIENDGNGGLSITNTGAGDLNVNNTAATTLNLTSGGSANLLGTSGASVASGAGNLNLQATGFPIIAYASGGASNAAMIQMRIDSTRYFIVCDNTPTTYFAVRASGTFMFNLPTSNPGVTGQLWNSGGTVKIV